MERVSRFALAGLSATHGFWISGFLLRKDLQVHDGSVDLFETPVGGRLMGSEWRTYIILAIGTGRGSYTEMV